VKFFFPLETRKTTFFAEIFKIQGDLAPPSDAHGGVYNDNEIYAPIQQTLQRMTENTIFLQTRMQLNLKKISK